MVTNLLRAPLLVLLSDVEGLYDGHPEQAGLAADFDGRRIWTKRFAASSSKRAVQAGPNHLSKGGMASKLEAARLATSAGENVVIANGRRPNVLVDILSGGQVGTLILAQGPAVASRKRWIGLTAQPCGKLMLDAGAQRAIEAAGPKPAGGRCFGRGRQFPQGGRGLPLPRGWLRDRPRTDQLRLARR